MIIDHHIKNDTGRPPATAFVDIAKYFTAYYHYRKQGDDQFSFEIWAVELGFKSKSQMRMICSGKRKATAIVIDTFCDHLKMHFGEREHIYLMAQYREAKSASQRALCLDRLIERLNPEPVEIQSKLLAHLLADKNLPVIQLLLGIEDFIGTETNLKNALGLSATVVRQYTRKLKELGVIREEKPDTSLNVRWRSESHKFKIPDASQNEAIKNFHRQTFKEMNQALSENPIMRRFRSLVFTLAEEDFTKFIEDTETFLKKINNKYGAASIQQKYVFKLNLNAYPVSEKIN